jgi:hypothetical protein
MKINMYKPTQLKNMTTPSLTNSINRLALRYGLFLIALALVFWAIPGTAHAQTPTPIPNLFVSVNAQPFINGGSFIYQYDPTGSTGTYTSFVSNLDHPRGVAFDSAGDLFVSTTTFGFDADDNIVSYHGAVLKVSGGVASSFATLTDGFASGLATDSAGNVFVSSQKFDDTVSTIYKVTPEGTVSTFGFDETIQGSVPGQCFGLAFDSAGNLFAAGAGNSTNTVGAIYKFTSGGVRTIFVGEEAFTSGPGPIDLTFDSSGSHFVSTVTSIATARFADLPLTEPRLRLSSPPG